MRFFRTEAGAYLGAFGPSVPPPVGGIEVPSAPNSAAAVWQGQAWQEPPIAPRARVLKLTIRSRLRAAGLEAVADAARLTLPASDQQDWADASSIFSDDDRVVAFLTAIGANPAEILAFDPDAPRGP